jgi:hypothetical protein
MGTKPTTCVLVSQLGIAPYDPRIKSPRLRDGCRVQGKGSLRKTRALKKRRSLRRMLATVFVFAATTASMGGLFACGEEAKEDPAEERQRELQQQVQLPEQTQSTEAEQTDRTVGENIQG